MLLWRIARRLLAMAGIVLLGGVVSATLVRMAPGFDTDVRQLDSHLNPDSLQALRDSRQREHNILHYYVLYLGGALHGDLGTSHALQQPVSNLLHDRYPVTMRVGGIGLLLGWLLAVPLALSAGLARSSAFQICNAVLTDAALCLPAAVLALLSVLFGTPGYLAVALIVFPRVYRYSRNLLAKADTLPHITAARARGLGEIRILLCHALPVVAPQLISLAGVTVSIALGACIPIESLCGMPGIGQLAWQAALARDLPLLVNVTLLVTLTTLVANSAADATVFMWRSRSA